ncbi:arylamine N-acetyltransferase [Paenibacillus sedimenti]|uniref:Arylamine N-acetyltransferase n=1 Tax=Paenibacillus sedimenti TaxID=2770274 RepID=A0A926KPW6_9BACL|nr:arylamine N-acetyltransferase [Paenibacillus sedimenti]MBD0380054.1 arylamine N-acetyltransferase [Paenibacillus sedimenti]
MISSQMQSEYLRCLKIEPQKPSMDYLRNLVKTHLERFPFENISKIRYYLHQSYNGLAWLPELGTFLNNFAAKGLGGNCYILNTHFGRLLHSLGYEVDIVKATGGNTHLALKVTLENQSYYADVGYGAPLFEPISLKEQPRFTREVEITKLGVRQFMIDRRMNGQSFVTKQIEWEPVGLEHFGEAITNSLRDEDDNPFMRRIVATVFKQDTAYSVMNQKLFIKTNQGTEVHEYTHKGEWLDMMLVTLGFEPYVVEEALEFLSDRGIRFW